MKLSWRDCLVGISYSSLCFLPALTRLGNGSLNYFRSGETFYRIFLPVLVLQGTILIALLAAWLLCCEFPKRFLPLFVPPSLRRLLFLASLGWPAAAIAQTILGTIGPTNLLQKAVTAAFVVTVILLVRSLNRLTSWARKFLLFVAPGAVGLCFYAGFSSFYYIGLFQNETPKPEFALQKPVPVRVVWIVFDELDYDVLTANRPASLTLPAFDHLMAQSFSGSQVRQPGARTRDSIPALITGREIAETRPTSPNDLTLVWNDDAPASSNTASWRNSRGVFDDASQLGFNTAVAGWYHPYGRVLGQHVNRFTSVAAEEIFGLDNQNASGPLLFPWTGSRTREQLISSITELPLVGKLPWIHKSAFLRHQHWKCYEALHRIAVQLAADDTFGLVFLHLPVPHTPGIWNRRTGKPDFQGGSYLDNVALADLALSDIMQRLDVSGESRKTALLVTADHGWRRFLWKDSSDWTPEEARVGGNNTPRNVPFFLKMPGQTKPLLYDESFSALLTRRIIGQILSGHLKTAQDIAGFLSRMPPSTMDGGGSGNDLRK